METRANHVWVGVVTLVLLALLAGGIVWIARLNEGKQNEFDIFFQQSVDGLAKGSAVTFAGVPVGQISQIELWRKDPKFVRVRINVDAKVPISVGTVATIQGSFTGVSKIQLEGAVKGAPPITEPGPEGVPVIPTRRSGLGEILNSAPLLMERLATLTENLNTFLSEDNRKSISGILANTDRMTADLASTTPRLNATLAELQGTLRQASATLAGFEKVAGSANAMLNEDGDSLAGDLRATLRSAQLAADELTATMKAAQPASRQFMESTLPATEATLRELRATSRALRAVTERIDEQGAGALMGTPKLPDYKP
jgi:phospholipid/cholesterol/gamma-HCH transport system substrate-binding protein